MTVYGILAHADNAYDVAAFEDISIHTASGMVTTLVVAHDEPVYLIYGEVDEEGSDVVRVMSLEQLDERYTYNAELITHTITKLTKK